MSIDKVLTYDTELTDDIGYTVHPINLALGESLGHTVKVNVYRNGTKITDSASCKAKFLRSDGSTVEINGTFASGVASVTLPSSCYTVEGAAKLSVSLVSGSTISTVFIMICNVNRYSTTAIVDSNQVVPNIETLLANVDKLETLIGEAEGLSLNKVGYAEVSGNVLSLYSDNTKKKVVSSVILPSGESSVGTGLTQEQLDALTQNTNARHTHSNKTVLDGITAEKIEKWDSNESYNDTELKQSLDDLNNDLSDLANRVDNISKNKNIVEKIINATIANVNGYVLYPNDNNRVIVFPVENGKTYTVYKGHSMSGARIAYSTVFPQVNSLVYDYADFSSLLLYKEFKSTHDGYACVKIVDGSEGDSVDDIVADAFVYEGSYDPSINKESHSLINVTAVNDISVDAIKKTIGSIKKVDLTEGFLHASISNQAVLTANTNNTSIVLVAKLESGKMYTVNKTVLTSHARIGYTGDFYPSIGDTLVGYKVLSQAAEKHITFTSERDGYAVIWIGFTTVTSDIDYIENNAYIYEGNYNASINKENLSIMNDVINTNHVFYCGNGRDLNTLKKGLEKACQYMDSVLYVDSGTYDLIQEFGQGWFDNLDGTTMVGLQLKNRVHVIFSPNSKVISHYTGNNENALKLYSPFNSGEYGFTLENLNLECSRCRYAIHDERNGGTEQFKSHYINCHLKIDNTDNQQWGNMHSIGGGLGTNAEVIIENCSFESAQPSVRWGVLYHTANSQNTNKKTTFVCKDCYFVSGCIGFEDAGANSTVGKSKYVVTNCSFPKKYDGTDANGVFRLNLSDEYADVMAWNNNFRS